MAKSSKKSNIILIIPTLIYLNIMTFFPIAYLVYLSFLKWNLFEHKGTFVGLQNFIQLLSPGSLFYQSLSITLLFAISATFSEFLFGLGVALLLNRENIIAKIIRGILIVPLMMAPVLIDMIWKYLYNPVLGPLTYFANMMGIMQPNFLDSEPNVFFSLIAVDIWQYGPFMVLIILSGLLSLPKEQFEAAAIDGANSFTQFRYIILPLLKPILSIAILFRFVDSMKVFNKIYILTAGGPGRATETLSYHIFYYSLGFTYDVGYGAAVSILFLIVVLFMTLVFMRAFMKDMFVKGRVQ
jgi:multiple sugar transport system permease protein